jgi:hypothetical protein
VTIWTGELERIVSEGKRFVAIAIFEFGCKGFEAVFDEYIRNGAGMKGRTRRSEFRVGWSMVSPQGIEEELPLEGDKLQILPPIDPLPRRLDTMGHKWNSNDECVWVRKSLCGRVNSIIE